MLQRGFQRFGTRLLQQTTASQSITMRVKLPHSAGNLARITHRIAELGGNLGAIDIVNSGKNFIVRDITVDTSSELHAQEITDAVHSLDNIEVMNVSDRVFLLHLGGKLRVQSKVPLRTRDDLSMAYTPGVARVCKAIHENKLKAWNLTLKRNTVAVVSDGTAVLGLGDIGPEAAMPVMEGKAQLFKEFANVDAFPICLNTKDTEEIISIVKALSPTFGGVNLEDISAPRCFEIESRLQEECDIPVFHDDQHGTAIVFGAGLINAMKVVGKRPEDLKVVVLGVGAAGTSCTNLMKDLGVTNIIGMDRQGALYEGRDNMNDAKKEYAAITNPNMEKGSVSDVIKGADLLVGLSGPDLVTVDDIKNMNKDPLVFVMSNPEPEIRPELIQDIAGVIATGRSDYPNQINNVLAFPGIFRGALDVQATHITNDMKLAAARAIASCVSEHELSADYIIPSVFNNRVVPVVSEAVRSAAIASGVARSKTRRGTTDGGSNQQIF